MTTFEHMTLQHPDDCFEELSKRPERGVYFCRINGYSETVKQFILKYYEAARLFGVVVEGRIPNPDERNLSYYEEIMGLGFQMNIGFLTASLKKWLPRMGDRQRGQVAASVYDTLDGLRREGKNENMLRNAYIKFMCWFYYKFERIVNHLGEEKLPKILYEGEISSYELKFLSILSGAGCDIMLLQYRGDQSYRKLDPQSALSSELSLPGMGAFPEGFSLKLIREERERRAQEELLYGPRPQLRRCTNAWADGKGLADVQKPVSLRGEDPGFFYNCFVRLWGAQDRLTFLPELLRFQRQMTESGRKILILEREIPRPSPEEIGGIRRNIYQNRNQMIRDMAGNIKDFLNSFNPELQRLMNQAFVDIMLEESERPGMNVSRLTNRAVYLLCWMKRYCRRLFDGWKPPQIACAVYLGGCRDENEAMLLKLFSRLPTDVAILIPDLNGSCSLADPMLYEIHYGESVQAERFPKEDAEIQVGTAAYHAEQDLTQTMYQDSGLYRNYQYEKASSLILKTTYEELRILWDQELKYRPNFEVTGETVLLPTLFAKVSGVVNGQIRAYWSDLKELITEDAYVIKSAPFLRATDPNPIRAHAAEFFRNGRLRRDRIMAHPDYAYGYLRDEMQEYILDKLQLLIDRRTIRGTFENGTEYTIVSVVLNMNKDILRLLQRFDFTKKNPKLIYINTAEQIISVEDSILAAFLNLAGFDVAFFVPTGYQSVEKYFAGDVMEEHQIGEYEYDLQVPDFRNVSSGARLSWGERIFKRGN
ncbi:MAG: YceG family protein [Eubacteriales bacterium]|nr:YceG family protein [Eubacteriales bacterium]